MPASTDKNEEQQCCCKCECGKRKPAAKSSQLFVDKDFPARWNSLYNPSLAAAWLRPHELRREPRLFAEGPSRFAVYQGYLDDSWFIAACAAIADRPQLLKQVVPEGQVLFGDDYDGSVTFRLWHLGEWMDVKIDDRLPVDGNGVPIYARCKHPDEFWLPLLEKAFAKCHKNYCYIDERYVCGLGEGLMSLTGYSLNTTGVTGYSPDYTFADLLNPAEEGALILCKATKSGPGLPDKHTYTVTKVYHKATEKEGAEELKLIRLRNPWGDDVQWKGAWNDEDERWNKLSKETKKAMEYKAEPDGEFWMDINDFCKSFSEICIGCPKPKEARKMKMISQIAGHWNDDDEEGGLPDDMEKFAKNPQFVLVALGCMEPDHAEEKKVEEKTKRESKDGEEEEEEEEEKEEPFNPMDGMDAVVELIQCHHFHKCSSNHRISCYIFETCTERRLTAQQMLEITYVTGATDCNDDNSVISQVRLHPGRRYVIVPTTSEPGQEGDFLLRIFSRHARVRITKLPP